MSSVLKNAAVAAVTRTQHSKFYDRENRPNPVLLAMDQELKLFMGQIKKRSSAGFITSEEEACSRGSETLFELWNKYEPRLQPLYYQKKLLEVGDILVSVKEYKLALWQCYERCLQTFGNINLDDKTDVASFKAAFFPDGFQAENTDLVFRALIGRSICMYHIVEISDPKLQNKQSIERCIQILSSIRLVTQLMLPKEHLCWLVYNGTIHIYSVCRHLMSYDHSSRVLEYLLWASMCMETSVPLLTAKYLSWRSILYTAVCQCYYDCKAGEHAENFARRSLTKIHDLSQLELQSGTKDMAVHSDHVRSATVRMAVMVFRRTVIESRRKPKGLLRPKTRANLKEVLNLPWPRTTTEKMLADMFEGGSAQFLAILETLNSSHRRILQTSQPASENDPEILDVYCELMMAAQEILAGNSGENRSSGSKTVMAAGMLSLSNVIIDGSLIYLATKGEDSVPLDSVIQLVKLAYCYEQWEIFDGLMAPLLLKLKESEDERFLWEQKALELLSVMGKVNASRRVKKQAPVVEEEPKPNPQSVPSTKKGKSKQKSPEIVLEKPPEPPKSNYGDDLLSVAEVLMSIVNGPYKSSQVETDMIADAILFLWSKCKPIFQKYQTGSQDNIRFLQKMENTKMWIYLLETVHKTIGWCGICTVDAAMTAEVALRLALIYESSAELTKAGATKSAQKERTTLSDRRENTQSTIQPTQRPLATQVSTRAQLLQAKEILQQGLKNVNAARRAVAMNDGKDVAEVAWAKEFNSEVFHTDTPDMTEDQTKTEEPTVSDSPKPDTTREAATVVWSITRDLHLELILLYHRVCLKLSVLGPDASSVTNRQTTKQKLMDKKVAPPADKLDKQFVGEDFSDLCSKCKRNNLSKALLYAQKAVILGTERKSSTQEQKKLLEDAASLIQKTQQEEMNIFCENTSLNEHQARRKVPAAPILVCRTDTYMVFKPAPFEPESGEKVAWYRIFARCASGPNIKARLNDNHFSGTGEQIPSSNCELKVSNLELDERYVVAVAAYTADGKLIGDHIGKTSKPILASNSLSVLTTWAFVAQMAYQAGCYSVCKQACSFLLEHFVMGPQPSWCFTYISETKKDFTISLMRLNHKALSQSSPILLRQFLTSIFISTDVAVKEGQLFCDIVCAKDIFYGQQTRRLNQCGVMLVAVELAGWLNETSLALQAVVQIYGLLASLLYHKIPSISATQILQRIHSVLQVIPPDFVLKRQASVSESLNHMVACITYNLAKALRSWGQKELANKVFESCRNLLAPDSKEEKPDAASEIAGTGPKQGNPPPKKKVNNEDVEEAAVNKELRALEAYMASVNQSASWEVELMGNEDPSVLYSYISSLSSSTAFKEVDKFKSKPCYLEFLVLVSQKGLNEGLMEQVINWCDDAAKSLTARNENMIGHQNIPSKQKKKSTTGGDDPTKFAAAMVQYKKEQHKPVKATTSKTIASKRAKYKSLRVTASMSDTAQQQQKEIELKALDVLEKHLVEIFKTKKMKKRFRKTAFVEMPWRSQMNIIQGLCHFNICLQKLDKLEKQLGLNVNRSNNLDPEWFTLETSGVLIVDLEEEKPKSRSVVSVVVMSGERAEDEPEQPENKAGQSDKQEMTPVELAAAALTAPTQPSAQPAEQEEAARLIKPETDKPGNKTQTPTSMKESLETIFTYFKRAIVLAHRNENWTLLQNACHILWNCAHTLLLHARSSKEDMGLVTYDTLRSTLCSPFYAAADYLTDMLTVLQDSIQKQDNRSKGKGDCLESWMGSIQSERGGASLKFDPLLDDTSAVDVRCVRKMVLRALELLYYGKKFEKLVDIALRFNGLTDNRYAEQVIPLMVRAQRFLEKRITASQGPVPPQPQFKVLEAQLGHVIRAKDYLKAQLTVKIDKDNLNKMKPGEAQIDPASQGTYSKDDAFRLSCVPLDTLVSLTALGDSIDQARYTARALQHSRKLLCLYLAGQQNHTDCQPQHEDPHVDFKIATGQLHPAMPPDKISSDYSHANEVEFSPIPRSQLGVVISSYEKTIDMLSAKNQKGLAAQAMHELGNIYLHAKNTKAALKFWTQAIDSMLNTNDSLHTWRSNFASPENMSEAFLDICGVWGCLLAGVLTSNIAQYILNGDNTERMECCLLSSYLFKALFRSSLPHPRADRDYAVYDVGLGQAVAYLVPGIDFTSERFRCDGRQLLGALNWLIQELSRAQHNLLVLPLLTLHQYFSTSVCRNVQRTVEGRILRARILTDLKLYAEAMAALQQLFNGEYLPQPADGSFRPKEGQGTRTLNYTNSKSYADPQNLETVETFMRRNLSASLATLYGPHLTCQLSVAQAHLLISLASIIPVLPFVVDEPPKPTPVEIKPAGAAAKMTPTVAEDPATLKKVSSPDKDDVPTLANFTAGTRTFSLEEIKLQLLKSADQIVDTVVENILRKPASEKEGSEDISADELELVVQCRLEQTSISQQKQHASIAAHNMLMAMKMIQKAQIFQHKKTPKSPPYRRSSTKTDSANVGDKSAAMRGSEDSDKFQDQILQARSRLDARLWLSCRCELVRSLIAEVRGMGEIKSEENKVVADLADCRQYCAEGLGEAELCGNLEMQAQFLFFGAQLNIVEGKSVEHTVSLLQECIKLLHQVPQRSDHGEHLLISCLMFKADLEAAASIDKDTPEKALMAYFEAQRIILNQLELMGEKIEHHGLGLLSSPVSPLQNVYLQHIQRLAEVKLRIGHAEARKCARMIRNGFSGDPVNMWTDCLGVLTTALALSQVSATREATAEAEILLMMGKVQKMLVYLDKYPARAAVNTLIKAIKISYINDHDLGLMRQAYLEIALTYLYSSNLMTVKEAIHLSPSPSFHVASIASQAVSRGLVAAGQSENVLARGKSETADPKIKKQVRSPADVETVKEKQAAWLAIQCATAVANAQRSRSLIIGNGTVISQKMTESILSSLPDFVSLDLLSRNVLGQKPKIYKNEIEEELAPLIEAQEVKVVETYEDLVNKIKMSAINLSWIHILGYQSMLQRLISTATISTSSRPSAHKGKNKERVGQDLDASSSSCFNRNVDVVRYMMHSACWTIRLAKMHSYLNNNLKIYATNCCAPFPPADLNLPKLANQPEIPEIPGRSYALNHSFNSELEHELISDNVTGTVRINMPPTSNLSLLKPPEKAPSAKANQELSLQWYQPGLGETSGSPNTGTSAAEKLVMLLFASTGTDKGLSNNSPGFKWVSLCKLNELHEKLATLVQNLDLSTQQKPRPPTSDKSSATEVKQTVVSKSDQDKSFKIPFHQCLDNVSTLLGFPAQRQEGAIPETNSTNIKNLEHLFDPSLGITLNETDLLSWLLRFFPTS